MVVQQPIPSVKYAHLNALDGFRACLALWVYLGHLAAAVGFKNYILDRHALAVDLFMVLSGFLMVHTWKQSSDQYRFFSKVTLEFYCARFFRIAPLYYFLLLVCYLMSPSLALMHDYSLKAIPPVWAANIEGYAPNTSWDFEGFNWVWLHLTFLFGLVPGMENSTPLPDWSLSLEMQFYLVLPLLLISLKKIPLIVITIACAALAFAAPKLFGNYLDAGLFTHFGQPSFLPYRLNAFLAGMVLALYLNKNKSNLETQKIKYYLIFLGLICISVLNKAVIAIYFIFVFITLYKVPFLSNLLSAPYLRLLGNLSYSLYLSHILIVIPTVYWLLSNTDFLLSDPPIRFIFAFAVSAPVVLIFSYCFYLYIEKPGISLGNFYLKTIRRF
jgi:peptidoglycan/LPS O-acetylase OafA/YrhL